jgi:hypothetical protein
MSFRIEWTCLSTTALNADVTEKPISNEKSELSASSGSGGKREAKVLSLDIACSLRSLGPPGVFKSDGTNRSEESQDNHKGFI